MSIDPRLIALFCIMFVGLGIFNFIMGRRRINQAQQSSKNITWYKQINILVGVEYFLLALAFFMNLALSSHWLPSSMYGIVIPFYLIVLVASGVLAGIVIFQGMAKRRRQRPGTQVVTNNASVSYREETKAQDHAYVAQKRRERRQKAAQARRRRAGKA